MTVVCKGGIYIMDDPDLVLPEPTEEQRQAVLSWFQEAASLRINEPGAKVVVILARGCPDLAICADCDCPLERKLALLT